MVSVVLQYLCVCKITDEIPGGGEGREGEGEGRGRGRGGGEVGGEEKGRKRSVKTVAIDSEGITFQKQPQIAMVA